MRQYITFKVHGNVSVEPEEPQYQPGDRWIPPKFICVLVMGPTGAGKSSFIEALCGDGSMGISKNQLEGYTKCISAYKMLNADFLAYGHNESVPIYLIDTPGFCDSTMSEMEIIKMLREWMASHGIAYFHHILYLLPITDIRLSGKKKRTIVMFQSIVGGPSWQLTIVTTMWDRVWNKQGKERAASNLKQLGQEAWKNYRSKGTLITRFDNTHESALDILGSGLCTFTHSPFLCDPLTPANKRGRELRDISISFYLFKDLTDRIDATRQQKETLEFDLAQPDTQAHEELRVILETRLKNAQQYLIRLEGQLRELQGEHEAKPDEPQSEFHEPVIDNGFGPSAVLDRLKGWFHSWL